MMIREEDVGTDVFTGGIGPYVRKIPGQRGGLLKPG